MDGKVTINIPPVSVSVFFVCLYLSSYFYLFWRSPPPRPWNWQFSGRDFEGKQLPGRQQQWRRKNPATIEAPQWSRDGAGGMSSGAEAGELENNEEQPVSSSSNVFREVFDERSEPSDTG